MRSSNVSSDKLIEICLFCVVKCPSTVYVGLFDLWLVYLSVCVYMSLSNLPLSVLRHLYSVSLFTGGPYMTNYVLQIRHCVFTFMLYLFIHLFILWDIKYSGISVIQFTLYVFAISLNIVSLFFYHHYYSFFTNLWVGMETHQLWLRFHQILIQSWVVWAER